MLKVKSSGSLQPPRGAWRKLCEDSTGSWGTFPNPAVRCAAVCLPWRHRREALKQFVASSNGRAVMCRIVTFLSATNRPHIPWWSRHIIIPNFTIPSLRWDVFRHTHPTTVSQLPPRSQHHTVCSLGVREAMPPGLCERTL